MKIIGERMYPMPSTRVEVCGHCHDMSVWQIESTDDRHRRYIDFECDKHARGWWPRLFDGTN